MGAEIAVGRFEDRLHARELDALAVLQGIERRHDAQPHLLMDDLVGRAHGSYAPHPEARQDQRAAADGRHPEREMRTQEDEATESKRRDRDAGNDVARPAPDAAQHIDQRDEERNESADLAAANRRHHEEGRGNEHEQSERGRAVAQAVRGLSTARYEKSRHKADRDQRGPYGVGLAREDIAQAIADGPDDAPDQEMRRGVLIFALGYAAGLGVFDVAQRGRRVLPGNRHGRSLYSVLQSTLSLTCSQAPRRLPTARGTRWLMTELS